MANTFLFDAFLSHNEKDKPRVRRLAKRLQAAGLRVWFDEEVIKPGDDIYLAVERGLATARVQVLCLSPAALGSDWVGLERSTVLFRDPSNTGRRFVPLLLDECDLPDTLRRYKYIDFREETAAAFEDLTIACRGEGDVTGGDAATRQTPAKSERNTLLGKLKSLVTAESEDTTGKVPATNSIEKNNAGPIAALERILANEDGWVHDVAISPDGTWMASATRAEPVRVWDLSSGVCRATLKTRSGSVQCLAISADGTQIVGGSTDGMLYYWHASDGQLDKVETIAPGHPHSICFVNSNTLLVNLISPEHNVIMWDIQASSIRWSLRTDGPRAIAIDRHRGIAMCGAQSGTIAQWNVLDGSALPILTGHTGQINHLQLTPDCLYAVTGSDDKTIKIWNLETKSCAGTLEGHSKDVEDISISPDGSLIASAGFTDRTVRIWELRSGRCLQILSISSSSTAIAFSPDGSRLVVGTAEKAIYVFRIDSRAVAPPAEQHRRYVNAKIVLIGESTVGKTTLAHRLIEDSYVKPDSTHGMNVSRLELPMDSDELLEREALLWDLAGQEDYRLIHQLYLEETALALLLINPQKDDPFSEAGDWLKALHAAVTAKDNRRDVVKFLIPTRLDVGGMTVSQKKIDRFLADNHIAVYLPTSAKRGDNCSDRANGNSPSELKQLIAKHIPWTKLPWTSTPRLLAAIKNAVMAMRDKNDIRLLRFAELAQRLEQVLPDEKILESDVRTAITLLANHGLVMPLKFGDLVLLRPELLNGYAAAIIRAARAHKDEIGCVTEEAIYGGTFDFTGVDRLSHRPDEDLLLRALVQTLLNFSLCIRETEDSKTLLVFPSQYRRDREIPKHPDIYISFSFSGELQTIYTTLIVRLWYSRIFDHKELWQNAAEFATSKGRSAGVLFEKLGDGNGKLSIFFDTGIPDELKVVFIEFVHRHLQKYGRDLKRERRYVCVSPKCGKPVKDIEAVQERIKAGKTFIICSHCDKHVPFRDHIEERLGSDPVARRVVAMDERATRELDTQALEQILIGHVQAICGEASQIFRELTKFDYGIDGEVEFKDDAGQASGRKIYVQLKSGSSYLRTRRADGNEIFDVKDVRHLQYWTTQPVDVYLVIRGRNELGEDTIRWMNVTRHLKRRKDKTSRQIVFDGEKLDFEAVWRVRDEFFPPAKAANTTR